MRRKIDPKTSEKTSAAPRLKPADYDRAYDPRTPLDTLYKMAEYAEDVGDVYAILTIQQCIEERLRGEDCPSPEAALIAACILRPSAVDEVRRLLPNNKAFGSYKRVEVYKGYLVDTYTSIYQDAGKVYQKILETDNPGDDDMLTWWNNIAESLAMPISEILRMAFPEPAFDNWTGFPYCNPYNAMVYARLIFAAAAKIAMIAAAEKLARGAHGDSPLSALEESLRALRALQARIVGASDLLVPHSE